MKIGVLELKGDEFITAVVKHLKGHRVRYIRLAEWKVPISSPYRVIIDRLSYDNALLRELLKNYSLDGAYVINNPFSASLSSKILDSKLCAVLGIPFPETRVFPIRDEGVGSAVQEPDWDFLEDNVSFPVVFKPFDGYAWEKVYTVGSLGELRNLYNAFKGENVMLVQEYVSPIVYRAFCLGKRHVLIKKWNPPQDTDLGEISRSKKKIRKWTIALNKALDFDFNTVEWSIGPRGKPFVIDAFNDVPMVSSKELNQSQFNWVVERFAECVEEKARSNEANKTVFKASSD